jgi:hypothetical protein
MKTVLLSLKLENGITVEPMLELNNGDKTRQKMTKSSHKKKLCNLHTYKLKISFET